MSFTNALVLFTLGKKSLKGWGLKVILLVPNEEPVTEMAHHYSSEEQC
jgi:hypothetical protein